MYEKQLYLLYLLYCCRHKTANLIVANIIVSVFSRETCREHKTPTFRRARETTTNATKQKLSV